MREKLDKETSYTKSEKREKIAEKLKKKRIRHAYGNLGELNLLHQQTGLSRAIKKMIRKKTKLK